MERKLYRDEYHKKIAGVCAGLAEYFNVDVAIVRVLFVLALIFHGGGLLVYVVLWIALPKKLYQFNDPTVDYRVPPHPTGSAYNDTYNNNPFGGNPWQGNPFPKEPFQQAPRSRSTTGYIFGFVLIVVGASILLDEYDIIPDWDIARLWPAILVGVGIALIVSGQKKQPWEKDGWHKADDKETENKAADAATGNPSTDNNPTV